MHYAQLAFNLLLLLAWVRLWPTSSREFHFNPFLSATVRLTDAVLGPLRALLRLPEPAVAALALLLVYAFRTLLSGRLGATWSCGVAGLFVFSQPPSGDQWGPHFLYSALHAGLFLARLWGVFLLVRLITPRQRTSRAFEAFSYFARPFSRLPLLAQPVLLGALHLVLVAVLARHGLLKSLAPGGTGGLAEQAVSPFLTGPWPAQALKTLWLAALSMSDCLSLLTGALFVLILGNIVAALLQAGPLMLLCHESAEMLMGRFARPAAAAGGGLNFAPFLFLLAANLLRNSVSSALFQLIHSPLLQ